MIDHYEIKGEKALGYENGKLTSVFPAKWISEIIALRSGAAFNRKGGGREITNPEAVEVVPTPEQGAV
jgi:hypothetical protein